MVLQATDMERIKLDVGESVAEFYAVAEKLERKVDSSNYVEDFRYATSYHEETRTIEMFSSSKIKKSHQELFRKIVKAEGMKIKFIVQDDDMDCKYGMLPHVRSSDPEWDNVCKYCMSDIY